MGVFIKNCEEANHVCDKNQYREASLIEKIRLTVHLAYCRACRKYTTNNTKLTKLLKKDKHLALNNEQKEKLQETFNEALKKAN